MRTHLLRKLCSMVVNSMGSPKKNADVMIYKMVMLMPHFEVALHGIHMCLLKCHVLF